MKESGQIARLPDVRTVRIERIPSKRALFAFFVFFAISSGENHNGDGNRNVAKKKSGHVVLNDFARAPHIS